MAKKKILQQVSQNTTLGGQFKCGSFFSVFIYFSFSWRLKGKKKNALQASPPGSKKKWVLQKMSEKNKAHHLRKDPA